MHPLELLLDPPRPGADNMQRDTELLNTVAAGDSNGTVRIYSFSPPCLTLGVLQSHNSIDMQACANDGIDVVTRPTGGLAVLHQDDVTYAVICRTDDPDFGGTVLQSCAHIHNVVMRGLRSLGITCFVHDAADNERHAAQERAQSANCFAQPASHEIVDARQRKLVGSAQARRGNALLQHGSVLLSPNSADRYLRQARTPSAPRSTTVSELRGHTISRADVVTALADAFRASLGARLLIPLASYGKKD